MEIFNDLKEQYVDTYGKTRIVVYNSGMVIYTPPLPSLNVKLLKDPQKVSTNKKTALEFIENYNKSHPQNKIIITMQDVGESSLQGLWIKQKGILYYGYIPLKDNPFDSKPLGGEYKNVPHVSPEKIDPMYLEGNSKLGSMRNARRISDILKKYVLYMYSVFYPEKPKYVIDKDHEYDISKLDKKFFIEGNDVIYNNENRIIVGSEKIKNGLKYHLKIQMLNNKKYVMNMKNLIFIPDYFHTLDDFKKEKDNNIFLSRESLEEFIHNKNISKNKIHDTLITNTKWPYFFNFRERIVMIQNVENGSLENAFSISKMFSEKKINYGYYTKSEFEKIDLMLYEPRKEDYVNAPKNEIININTIPLIKYENDDWAAVLI